MTASLAPFDVEAIRVMAESMLMAHSIALGFGVAVGAALFYLWRS